MSDALHARELAALARDLVAAFGETTVFASTRREGEEWETNGRKFRREGEKTVRVKGDVRSSPPGKPVTPPKPSKLPEPRDEMPLPKPSAARRALVGKLGRAFAGVSPEWDRAAVRVVGAMPDRAARLATRLRVVRVARTDAEFVDAVRTLTGGDPAKLAGDMADTHGIYLPGSRAVVFRAAPLRLSGGIDPIRRVRGFVAHEMAHAVDDSGVPGRKRFSGTPGWQAAWDKDLARGGLSRYGGASPSEGFVEFARAAWAGNVPLAKLKATFPVAAQFFEDNGLWPEATRAKDPARERLSRAASAGYSPGAGNSVWRKIRRAVGFSEDGFSHVEVFAWKQGARGGKYWLPDGKQDVPANRLYGAKAQKAAGAEKATAKSGAGPREPSPAAKEKIARAKFEVARDAHAQAVRDKLPADKVEWLRNRAAKAAEELQAVAKAKPAPKPRPRPRPKSAAPGVLGSLAAIPGRVAGGIADTIKAAHARLKERYGAGAANAVIATGALGLPIPVPGAALATAAPALAVAEIGRQLGLLKGERPRKRTRPKSPRIPNGQPSTRTS